MGATGGIGILGPLTISGNPRALPPRERIVLAVLSIRANETVSPESLADAIWGDLLPATWTKSVQACIVQLRRVLDATAIETQPHGYRLVLPADLIDAHRFQRLLARARELLVLGDVDRALYLADEALSLWRGRALIDLEGWQPGRAEAERLQELRREVQEVRLEAALRSGRFREVLVEARTLVADAPLREHRWSLLALAEYQAGRQGEALRTIRHARDTLREELGLDPGPELVTLEQAILRQDPSLVAAALPEPSAVCPYLGLVPYDVSDADGFFGRDAEVAECLHRLAQTGLLAVVGPSGSGKSSLVRAGVAAALEKDGHRVVVITPGAQPDDVLPSTPTTGRAPVLLVDQCEEAVTHGADADQRAQFFSRLANYANHAPLVVALRADRLGELTAHPQFARLIERGLFLLRPMEGDDLRAAIEGPARHAGLLIEPGLVDLLIRDVEGEPGALPLLSHALQQTWEDREGRTLTVAGYQESGGIRGAVARSAEAVYEQAYPEQRPVLRDLLLRLVAPSPQGEPVRSRVPRRVVATDAAHEQIIEQLVRARLVISDEDVVEIAHESLARAWPRLQGWLDDDVEGQRIWRHLSSAADGWDAMGRPGSELYRGLRLARAVEWRDRTHPNLNPTEQTFLTRSEQHVENERRSVHRRRRTLVGALAIGLAVTTALAAIALVSQQRADREAAIGRSRELTNAAIIALGDDPSLAKLLALAAADGGKNGEDGKLGDPSVELLSVLHRSLSTDRVVDRYRWPDDHAAPHLTASIHPDGSRLVAAGTFGIPVTHLEVYDFDNEAVQWSWDTGDPAVSVDVPIFSPDGEWVAAGIVRVPDDGPDVSPTIDSLGVYIWDADTGELARRIDMGSCGAIVLDMSASSMLVQAHGDDSAPDCWTGSNPLELIVVDVETGAEQVVGTDAWGRRGALSGDGRRVAFTEDGDAGPASVVLDLASGERILEFDPFASQGHAPAEVIALNRDGSLVAAGVNPIMVWDVATGERIATFDRHGGDAWPRFAPEGSTVYSVGQDSTLRHWDARTGAEIASYPAVGRGLAPSVDQHGRVLVADANGRQASLVDTRPAAELWSVETCDGYVWAQTLGISGDHAALSVQCADEHLTYVIDVGRRQVDYTLPLHRGQALVISPDGTRFVRQEGNAPDGTVSKSSGGSSDGASSAFWHGPPRVRDLATGETLAEFEDVCTYDASGVEQPTPPAMECRLFPETPFELFSWGMAWSPDSTMVAVGGAPRVQLAVWDADSGSMVAGSGACSGMAQGMQFSPDGAELFLFCMEEAVLSALSTRSWDELRRAELDPELEGRSYMAFAGFTPDDRWLVGVGGAMFVGGVGMLHWIDPETLEIDQTLPRIHDGTPKSWAMSPDRTLLATGASDGSVRVWDVIQRRLVHEIDIGDVQVQGLAFVNENHLAVAPEPGGVFVYTLDAGELLDLVRSSLTRGLTTAECQRFNFDVCPALDDLRARPQ